MSVDAVINYGKELDGRIYYDVATGKTNLEYVAEPVVVHDARPALASLSLESHGFTYLRHASRVKDWDSEEEIRKVCYPEAVEVALRATGAKAAVVFDHTLRRSSARDGAFARDPVAFVHLDYTNSSAPKRLKDFFGNNADHVGRWGIANVWRPINVPKVVDVPLGVIDATTCPATDLLAYDIVYPDRVGGNYIIRPNPQHRWYYLRDQTPEEVCVFKQYDSDEGRLRYAPHSAFTDEKRKEGGGYKPRESIELRLFVFYEDELPRVLENPKL
ncbi:hypothetical protein DFJ74DRAFT_645534 [Hyaloraphidium curvatum]|nr:hypothetical protein DFJ74DRAFT_645534 [Hyaloraphidium curvatum]